jgi:hypothetical protein
MAKQTSIAHQKYVLEQFLLLLSGFENEFKGLVQRYEQSISTLYEDLGLLEEIYEDYRNLYMEPMKEALLNLVARIREEDIPFIEKEIDFISSR